MLNSGVELDFSAELFTGQLSANLHIMKHFVRESQEFTMFPAHFCRVSTRRTINIVGILLKVGVKAPRSYEVDSELIVVQSTLADHPRRSRDEVQYLAWRRSCL